MSVPLHHVLHQGPMLATLGRAALSTLTAHRARTGADTPIVTPTAELSRTAPPPPRSLIDDYVRWVGGDPRSYRTTVPAHLFPHWAMPLAAATLQGVAYPMTRVLNAGCRVQINGPLPAGEPLLLRGWLASIDDDGQRALLQERVVTGTRSAPEALITDFRAFVPLARGDGSQRDRSSRERPRVPSEAREIAWLRLKKDAGLEYAKLTGDFNPIHWVPAAARAAGFRSVVLHGFATLAVAHEALNRAVFAGDVGRLAVLDVRFTRPLTLPHEVGVFVHGQDVYVGDAPGGPAHMTGTYATRDDP